jgi:hypothetical protein
MPNFSQVPKPNYNPEKSGLFWFSPWPCFSVLVGKAHGDPRAIKGSPVLRVRRAIRGRPAPLAPRGPKPSKDLPARKVLRATKDHLDCKARKAKKAKRVNKVQAAPDYT